MEEISINGCDFSTTCRLCLSRGVTAFDIFYFSYKMGEKLSDVIMTCAPVQVRSQQIKNKLVHVTIYFIAYSPFVRIPTYLGRIHPYINFPLKKLGFLSISV